MLQLLARFPQPHQEVTLFKPFTPHTFCVCLLLHPNRTLACSYNRVVVSAIGDPLAPEGQWLYLTDLFLQEFPEAYFYHASEKYAALLHDMGYFINDVGAETTLQVRLDMTQTDCAGFGLQQQQQPLVQVTVGLYLYPGCVLLPGAMRLTHARSNLVMLCEQTTGAAAPLLDPDRPGRRP